MLRARQIVLLMALGSAFGSPVLGQEADSAQDGRNATGGGAGQDDRPDGDDLQANPEMVDPLLGMEIEALRRIVQEMDARVELLEDRVVALEGGEPAAQ